MFSTSQKTASKMPNDAVSVLRFWPEFWFLALFTDWGQKLLEAKKSKATPKLRSEKWNRGGDFPEKEVVTIEIGLCIDRHGRTDWETWMKKSMGGGQEVKKGGGCRCAREGRTPSTAGRTKNMERNADCRIRPECLDSSRLRLGDSSERSIFQIAYVSTASILRTAWGIYGSYTGGCY